jgi:glycosyltransferase involved in cell wall biosynthesis
MVNCSGEKEGRASAPGSLSGKRVRKEIRIAVLSPFAGTIVGGIETVARELKAHLPFETEVLSILPSGWTRGVGTLDIHSAREQQWIRFVRLTRLWYLNLLIPGKYPICETSFLEYHYCRRLGTELRRFSPALLINPQGPIVASFCSSYRRKNGTPFICVGENGRSLWERRSAGEKPEAYVALTPPLQQYMRGKVPGVRIEQIPNGVNCELFSPDGDRFTKEEICLRAKKEGPPEPPFVISSSRFVKEKQLHLLFEAMRLWGKGCLLAAGGGQDQKSLVALGDRLLGRRFFHIGDLPYEELPKFYRMGHLFALPSKAEPFGNVMIEAMACGLPVISRRDPNREWIVGKDGGVLFDGDDPPSFAGALSRAWEVSWGKRPLGEAARFDWRKVAAAYAQLIEEILAKR